MDYRFAMVCSVISNLAQIQVAKGQRKTTTPLDFIIKWDKEEIEEKAQTPEEMKKFLMALAGNNRKPRRKNLPKKDES